MLDSSTLVLSYEDGDLNQDSDNSKAFSFKRQYGILTTMLTTATRDSGETTDDKKNVNEWYAPSLCTDPIRPPKPSLYTQAESSPVTE